MLHNAYSQPSPLGAVLLLHPGARGVTADVGIFVDHCDEHPDLGGDGIVPVRLDVIGNKRVFSVSCAIVTKL